jgi:TPR repeat protein
MKSLMLLPLAGIIAFAPALGNTVPDDSAAIAELRPLAIAGDPDAQVHLGQAYQLGRGVPVDLKLAEDWFRRAAQHGSDDGKDNYGLVLFQTGKRAQALPYIEDAAGRGNPRAQYILGTALFNGDMIAKDWPRSYAMMTRASTAGIPAARNSLSEMDKYIPLDQRKRGLVLAEAFANHASSRAPSPAPAVSDLPPPEPKSATARSIWKPGPVVAKVAPRPAALPAGNWRIQFGAYGDEAKARALWPALRDRIPALRPYSAFATKAGNLTRLRAGPLANRAAAEKLCVSVRAGGQACITIAP